MPLFLICSVVFLVSKLYFFHLSFHVAQPQISGIGSVIAVEFSKLFSGTISPHQNQDKPTGCLIAVMAKDGVPIAKCTFLCLGLAAGTLLQKDKQSIIPHTTAKAQQENTTP